MTYGYLLVSKKLIELKYIYSNEDEGKTKQDNKYLSTGLGFPRKATGLTLTQVRASNPDTRETKALSEQNLPYEVNHVTTNSKK